MAVRRNVWGGDWAAPEQASPIQRRPQPAQAEPLEPSQGETSRPPARPPVRPPPMPGDD